MRRILERLSAWLRPPPPPELEVELDDDDDGDDDEDRPGGELYERLIQHALKRPLVGLCLQPERGWFAAWIETVAPEYLEYRTFDVTTCRAGTLYLLPLGAIHEVCVDSLELQRAWIKLNYLMPAEGEEEQPDAEE